MKRSWLGILLFGSALVAIGGGVYRSFNERASDQIRTFKNALPPDVHFSAERYKSGLWTRGIRLYGVTLKGPKFSLKAARLALRNPRYLNHEATLSSLVVDGGRLKSGSGESRVDHLVLRHVHFSPLKGSVPAVLANWDQLLSAKSIPVNFLTGENSQDAYPEFLRQLLAADEPVFQVRFGRAHFENFSYQSSGSRRLKSLHAARGDIEGFGAGNRVRFFLGGVNASFRAAPFSEDTLTRDENTGFLISLKEIAGREGGSRYFQHSPEEGTPAAHLFHDYPQKLLKTFPGKIMLKEGTLAWTNAAGQPQTLALAFGAISRRVVQNAPFTLQTRLELSGLQLPRFAHLNRSLPEFSLAGNAESVLTRISHETRPVWINHIETLLSLPEANSIRAEQGIAFTQGTFPDSLLNYLRYGSSAHEEDFFRTGRLSLAFQGKGLPVLLQGLLTGARPPLPEYFRSKSALLRSLWDYSELYPALQPIARWLETPRNTTLLLAVELPAPAEQGYRPLSLYAPDFWANLPKISAEIKE